MFKFPRMRSIERKLKTSYMVIIAVMILIPVMTMASSLIQTAWYDKIITNVSKTNSLNQRVRMDITNEIWDIVAGNKKFKDGVQYAMINSIRDSLNDIMSTTDVVRNRQLLTVAGRAVGTLTSYVDRLGDQISRNEPVEGNEKILDEIRGVVALISDILQDFTVLEIEAAARTNERIKAMVWILTAVQVFVVSCVAGFAVFAQRSVSRSINRPIRELERLSTAIASGNLDARANIPGVFELDNLTINLNVMAQKIRELIDENIREQKNLQKSEMKALQAQITPHFLYNTLDTIVWLAEEGKKDQVIDVTRAFSNFFRVSLSRGKEWITVEEEVSHVRSYLTIQKIRYRDILDYSLDVDPQILSSGILKLVLQPLVENALYHGIKNKRGRGYISIRGSREGNRLRFTVTDDGIGMSEERLAAVLTQIQDTSDPEDLSDVYGLYNVTRRMRLYYGEAFQFKVTSTLKEGTEVTFILPEVFPDV